MKAANPPTSVGPRIVLSLVLLGLGVALFVNGSQLLLLGGTAYYLSFSLALLICAYDTFKGVSRALWVYMAALIATVIWAFWETQGALWGLQARLFIPAILGIWVFLPWLKRVPRGVNLGITITALLSVTFWLVNANKVEGIDYTAPRSLVEAGEWHHYGNDTGGSRFSPLTQINPTNIAELEQAWVYRTGASHFGNGLEVTPLMVGNAVYLCTADNVIHAIDPETGKRKWTFDPEVDAPGASACRGVAYFEADKSASQCSNRIIFATADARLMAVDSATGELCEGFGEAGTVSLKRGMGEVLRGYYYVSSAPTLVRGKVVVGGWVMDNQSVAEPSGVIRAYDAATGKFAWAWDMDRPDFHSEPAEGETYSRGTANSWAPMSGDNELGHVYVPTGNATPDYWAGQRSKGSEKYGSSVVALNIETGDAIWHFQTTHHDLWDYDVGSQPTLVDLPIDGQIVPALIQPTKRGENFLLDRRTGETLAEVEERPVPQGGAEGDFVAPTQPFSIGMPAFDRTVWTEETMWGAVLLDQLWCRIQFKRARYDGSMTPPGIDPTLYYPSYLGGNGWGGVAIDPERRLMVSNWNRMLNYVRLVPRSDATGIEASKDGGVHIGQPVPQIGTPFAADIKPFMSPIMMPCNQPPFGMITVVDLDTRKVVWEKPLGTSKDSGPMGTSTLLPLPVGVPNQGGSLTTRAGLIFIGASQERVFRAFDIESGKLLWKAPLPAGGNAGPMTYISPSSGRQFIVIAAGGNAPLSSGRSDQIIAYALPEPRLTSQH